MGKTSVVGFFSKHLIGLAVTFRAKNSKNVCSELISGCLIEFSNQTYLLSSGHHIPYLKDVFLLEGDKSSLIVDYFGNQAQDYNPIPFVLDFTQIIHIDDDENGLDFYLIPLSNYYMRLINYNNLEAIKRKDWISIDKDRISDRHFLLGFPSSLVESGDALGSFGAKAVITSVEQVTVEEATLDAKIFPRFVGRLNADFDMSPKGMSGGPIFGLSPDGKKYWIVAIQSSWNKTDNKIFGCQIPILAYLVEKSLK
jgi:hypothetical protein